MQNNYFSFSQTNNTNNNNNIVSCGDFEVNINRQPIKSNPNKDYKKLCNEKIANRILKNRENRMDTLRSQKQAIMSDIFNELTEDIDISEQLLISEYFDYIITLFEDVDDSDTKRIVDILDTCDNIRMCPICFKVLF